MRIRIVRAVVLAGMALTAMTGVAQAAPAVTASQTNTTTLSGSTAMAISGHYAYTVSYWSGQLCVFDVSNPAAGAVPVGTCTPAMNTDMTAATNIAISGNFAYVTSKNRNQMCIPSPIPACQSGSNDDGTGNSLTVVDISNPTAPTIVGQVRDPTNLFGAEGVAVATIGGTPYAFVASQGLFAANTFQPQTPDTSTGSFSVWNLTNPANPTLTASLQNSSLIAPDVNALQHATSVAVYGTTAFVTAQYSNTLTAIDISNPAVPNIVDAYASAGKLSQTDDVAVAANGSNVYAYVTNQVSNNAELTVFNVTNPASIAAASGTSFLQSPQLSGAYRLVLNGNTAYIAANGGAAIAAVNISNPSAPTLIGATQDTTHLQNTTDVAFDPNGRFALGISPNTGTALAPTYPPYPFQPSGPNVPGTLSMITLTAAISSEPPNPSTSTSASFGFTSDDPNATFTCSLDGAPASACSGAASQSYTGLSAGSHTLTVQATDPFGLTALAAPSYTWTVAPILPPPSIKAFPTLSGKSTYGQRLSVSNGTWTNATSFTYGWHVCSGPAGPNCTPISGQTASTYKVQAADVGQYLEGIVTAHNSSGSTTVHTSRTAVVKWPTGSFGSGRFHFSRVAGASLTVSVPSPGSNLMLTKLVLGLPAGVSWAGPARHLATGLVVKDGSGRNVRYSLSLSHGKLTLTFRRPPTAVRVTVDPNFVKASYGLIVKLLAHQVRSMTSSLSATYHGTPVRQGSATLRVR